MRKLTLNELKKRQQGLDNTFPVSVLLENVRSMHNVGSFFRTGDAAGITELFITGYTAYPPRAEITKVALGAEERIPFTVEVDLIKMVRIIKKSGFTLVGVEQTTVSVNLWTVKWPEKCCFVFGNEVTGISSELLKLCDLVVEVPMSGIKESLNVSVCAGIVLFEYQRVCRGQNYLPIS